MATAQEKIWLSDFGQEYTDRNNLSWESYQELTRNRYGLSRLEMAAQLLDGFDRRISILEVGTNRGLELITLKRLSFINLFGLEIQWRAARLCLEEISMPHIVQGSALDLPFADDSFDMVFTSGLLIHIHPRWIKRVMMEINRCSRKFIWGFEYHIDRGYGEAAYRGQTGLLWKTNFSRLYCQLCPELKLEYLKIFKYSRAPDLRDALFLMSKQGKSGN